MKNDIGPLIRALPWFICCFDVVSSDLDEVTRSLLSQSYSVMDANLTEVAY